MSRAGVVFRAIGTLFQIGIAGLAAKPYGFWHSLFVSCIMSLVGLMVRLYSYLSLIFCLCFSSRFFLLSSFLLEGLECSHGSFFDCFFSQVGVSFWLGFFVSMFVVLFFCWVVTSIFLCRWTLTFRCFGVVVAVAFWIRFSLLVYSLVVFGSFVFSPLVGLNWQRRSGCLAAGGVFLFVTGIYGIFH